MKKTTFAVSIHKSGTDSDTILRAIAAHNEGKATLELGDFAGFLALWSAAYNKKGRATFIDEHSLAISEDGGATFTLTIEERELIGTVELSEAETNLINLENLS